MNEDLRIWTVYKHPVDFPNDFVVRGFTIRPGGEMVADIECLVAPTLELVQSLLPPGLHNLGRQDGDPDNIVESWV